MEEKNVDDLCCEFEFFLLWVIYVLVRDDDNVLRWENVLWGFLINDFMGEFIFWVLGVVIEFEILEVVGELFCIYLGEDLGFVKWISKKWLEEIN